MGALTPAAATATDLSTLGGNHWWQLRARRRAAIRMVRLTVRTLTRPAVHGGAGVSGDPDQVLCALLTGALTRLRRLVGLPAAPALTRPAAACRVSVPVHSELRAPDGAESLYHHASAITDAWPHWLLDTATLADRPLATGTETVKPAPFATAAENPEPLVTGPAVLAASRPRHPPCRRRRASRRYGTGPQISFPVP